jgi:hypothetical protein
MDTVFVSALAALAGSVIGGLTSLAASWLTQHTQFKAQRLQHDIGRREDMYRDFINEASKLYTEAYGSTDAEPSKLVNLYALISRMRILSSPKIVEQADHVVRVIVETYLAPNKSFADLRELLDNQALNPLRDFSNACRDELRKLTG